MFTIENLERRAGSARPGVITLSQGEVRDLLQVWGLRGESPELQKVRDECAVKVAALQDQLAASVKETGELNKKVQDLNRKLKRAKIEPEVES